MALPKALPDQCGKIRVEAVEARTAARGRDGQTRLGRVGPMPIANAVFDRRRVALAQPLRSERVISLHEKLEDQHGQAEAVVFRLASSFGEGLALEFGRRVLRLPHRAWVQEWLGANAALHLE